MRVVNSNTKLNNLILVNKSDLLAIQKNGIIDNKDDDKNLEKIYLIENENKKFDVLLIKNKETKKISTSVKKINTLIKSKSVKYNKYELKKMSLDKYINKKSMSKNKNSNIKNNIKIDVDKNALEKVLSQVVETIIDKSENKMNTEEKIVTEYIEEKKEKKIGNRKYLEEQISKIKLGINNNKMLIISENTGKVYLPYTISELEEYMYKNQRKYSNIKDLIEREYIIDYNKYFEKPVKARFLETYKLIKNREGKNIFIALFNSIKMMFYRNINAAIIAACKKQIELNNYLYFLKNENTEAYEYFKIIYDINPIKQK